jgi:hypothetical protein
MRRNNATANRQRAASLSRTMKAQAEVRRCPKCQRKSAMVRHKVPGDHLGFLSVAVCRWCGHEKQ